MNRHLSSQQVSSWILGEHSSQLEQHLRECAACRSEVVRFEQALAGYRGAVHAWSDSQLRADRPDEVRVQPQRSLLPVITLRWVGVVAALVMMVWLSLAPRPARSKTAVTQDADTVLLNRIHSEVSRTVPAPMEPLTKLVSWDVQ